MQISAITEEFLNPADAESFQGFVNFVGDIGENGALYITVGDITLHVLSDRVLRSQR